jgi:large subunit ribosomal protein L22
MVYKYAFQNYEKEKMARAVGLDLPISKKHSAEIANAIRHKTVARAKKILDGLVKVETPIQYTRFNKDLGHKKGIGPGRYPSKAAENILKIVESAEKNANTKGIANPSIIHIAVMQAPAQWHYGRKRRRKMKRAHVEIVVATAEGKTKAAKKETKSEKTESKTESKEKKSQSKEHKQ